MTKLNYAQQIKHPSWQKKRLEVLELHNFECMDCGSADKELHVHHPFYKKGAMIWEYETRELECLCHKCHKDAHALDERIKKALSYLTLSDKNEVLGYIEAMQGNTLLNPISSAYCNGVSNVIWHYGMEQREINTFYDKMEMFIQNNRGKGAADLLEICKLEEL